VEILAALIHVEVALEDSLLHGIGHFGLLGHLAYRRFHNGNAFGALVGVGAQHGRRAGHGASLSPGTEVLREVVAFACER
jgi:hypothetical protein